MPPFSGGVRESACSKALISLMKGWASAIAIDPTKKTSKQSFAIELD
jgi:hypothetical protein